MKNESAPAAAPGDKNAPGGSLDLENVNPLQQAILQRVRDAQARERWLPEMSVAQWIVSAFIAIVLVAGIFNVVDAGLTAFQKFTEVSMGSRSSPPAEPVAAEATPAVDVTKPFAVILVPESPPVAPPTDPAQN